MLGMFLRGKLILVELLRKFSVVCGIQTSLSLFPTTGVNAPILEHCTTFQVKNWRLVWQPLVLATKDMVLINKHLWFFDSCHLYRTSDQYLCQCTVPTAWQVSTSDKCLSDVPVVRTRRYCVSKHLAVGKDCEAFVVFSISYLICQINFRLILMDPCIAVWLSRNTNKMQLCNIIYCSKVYWRLKMFRAAHHSSSGALNFICSLWFIYPCGDRPLSRLSGEKKEIFPTNIFYYKAASCWYFYWVKASRFCKVWTTRTSWFTPLPYGSHLTIFRVQRTAARGLADLKWLDDSLYHSVLGMG